MRDPDATAIWEGWINPGGVKVRVADKIFCGNPRVLKKYLATDSEYKSDWRAKQAIEMIEVLISKGNEK